MDRERFDALTRLLAATPSRRAALGALLGTGLAGTLGVAEAAQKKRNKQRQKRTKNRRRGGVSAQAADCSSPGQGSNYSGCNFDDEDFSGEDLSSSRGVETSFRTAELVGTDFSSSNLKSAVFRNANLCGADLSSSTLRSTNFRDANLTNADLSSSVCGGAIFTGATFCNTRTCNGAVRNDDCPDGVAPEDACCVNTDCPAGQRCADGACVLDCLTADTCCGTNPVACRANCCTGVVGDGLNVCGGPGNFNCAPSFPGGPCGTDDDCTAPIGESVCRAGRCCSLQGGFCNGAADCCNEAATCNLQSCSA